MISFVQSTIDSNIGSSSTASLTGVVTGDTIIVGIGSHSSATVTVTSITDSAGNTYIQAPSARASAGPASIMTDIWYAKNVTGGSLTITTNFSSSIFFFVVPSEFSGIDHSSPLESASNRSDTSGVATPILGPALTNTNSTDLLLTVLQSDGSHGGWNTFLSPWTTIVQTDAAFGVAYYLPGSTGTFTAAGNNSMGQDYCSSGGIFIQAGSGPLTLNLSDTQSSSDVRHMNDNPKLLDFEFMSDAFGKKITARTLQEVTQMNEWITLEQNPSNTWTNSDDDNQIPIVP